MQPIVAQEPLHEGAGARLMLALAGSGQQAAALRFFTEMRARLVEELGVEPGAEILAAHLRVVRQELPVAASSNGVVAHPAGAFPRPAQLPVDIAGFAGRVAHLAQLNATLRDVNDDSHITVINGTAGVGKTALAVHFGHQVADRFPDGQLYLDLRGYAPTSPMTVGEALGSLLRSLGLPPERIPVDEQEQAAAYRSLVAGKRMLVVLDNARSADQIRPLLPASPHCLVVTTSRTTLTTIDGATHLHLDVLSEQEALTLLARLAGPDRVAAEPDAAATLVGLCARLPLAVRIAGARLAARPGWPIHTVVERLTDEHHRLDELRMDDRAVRASFAVSYHTLQTSDDPVDQTAARAFRLLGALDWVDVSVPVAAALIDRPQPDTHAALERLVDDHLLDSPTPSRYDTHDLLRLYARDLAHDHPEPERDAALVRVLHCYLAAAEQTTQQLEPRNHRLPADPTPSPHDGFTLSSMADATEFADAERPNLIAVTHQAATTPGAAPALAVRLTAAICLPFDSRGSWHELIPLGGLAAHTARRLGDRPGEALARHDLGFIYTVVGRSTDAIVSTQQALAIYREIGDRPGEQRCLLNLGYACRQQQRFAEAIAYLEQGLAICEEIGHRHGAASQLDALGLVHQRLHRFDQAIDFHRQALAIDREDGRLRGQATALVSLGWAHHRAQYSEQAIADFLQCLTLERHLGRRYGEAESLWGLGQAHHTLGNHDQASTYWRQSIAILRDIGELTDDEASALLCQPVPDTPEIIQRNT